MIWRARIIDGASFALRDVAGVLLWREAGDGLREIVTTTGREYVDGAQSLEEEILPTIPRDALEDLRSALESYLGAGADGRAEKELRASLEHERSRVDRVLGSLLEERTR